MSEDKEFEFFDERASAILLAELQTRGKRDEVSHALTTLLDRMHGSLASLSLLLSQSPKHSRRDAMTILRTIYDAHVQILYILKDPEPRAKLYNDFYWVEWSRFVDVILRQPGKMFESFAKSQNRAVVEPKHRAEFDRVEVAFRKGSGHRRDWFEGSIEDLAKAVGYFSECVVMSRLVNPTIHSSAFGLRAAGVFTESAMMQIAWQLYHRCIGRIVEYEGLTTNIPADILEHFVVPSYKPIFEIDDATLERIERDRKG